MNKAQFQALFTNAFGADPSEFGIEIDDSQPLAVGRAGEHVVSASLVSGMMIDWQIDGQVLMPWDGVLPPNSTKRVQNGDALRARLA